MAARSLTDVFLLMRSNAIRNRNIFPDNEDSEQMRLVSLNDEEETLYSHCDNHMPPSWINHLEKAQSVLHQIHMRTDELKSLHSKHLHKSTFDDSSTDEEAIEYCTQEISRLFNEGHKLVQVIKHYSCEGSTKEQKITVNVYCTLAASLQDLSQSFKSTQNSYLRELQSREDRSKVYFENQVVNIDIYDDSGTEDIDSYFIGSRLPTQEQILFLEEENSKFALEREQEVNSVVKSILEVNKIFKELSIMVADQGTVLDRIDYNIEKTQIDVFEGFKQLRSADAYQRKNRKMCTIVVLAIVTILVFFLLVLIKF
ncbi:syntaxin-16 [Coccinella septempunctata]|uniref:syntaxin-16 n=1 Tax=Coccinella septempunctata TaxID=41139 RepID=UPI001D08C5B9|nr:syntaxin-16 [Coccinella septempunctata]